MRTRQQSADDCLLERAGCQAASCCTDQSTMVGQSKKWRVRHKGGGRVALPSTLLTETLRIARGSGGGGDDDIIREAT
jgi:hypothetical protein